MFVRTGHDIVTYCRDRSHPTATSARLADNALAFLRRSDCLAKAFGTGENTRKAKTHPDFRKAESVLIGRRAGYRRRIEFFEIRFDQRRDLISRYVTAPILDALQPFRQAMAWPKPGALKNG
jgi:hypothetical protein